MTTSVAFFAQHKFKYIYLGTCYTKNALYKTQFAGTEFFNGFRWSENIKELKYLIKREKQILTQHLLETDQFRDEFYNGNFSQIIQKSEFTI